MEKYLLSAILVLSACSTKKAVNEKNENENDTINVDSTLTKKEKTKLKESPKITFPLDSLLSFDSEVELKNAFGDENVRRSTGYLAEGEGTYENTLLYPQTKNQVEFMWKDDSINFNKLSVIHLRGEESDWETKEGIKLGTKLTELEKYNQKPFTFWGFGWDYSGTVFWNGGHLDDIKIGVTLEFPTGTVSNDYLYELSGDKEFKSDSELAQKVNPIVVRIGMSR